MAAAAQPAAAAATARPSRSTAATRPAKACAAGETRRGLARAPPRASGCHLGPARRTAERRAATRAGPPRRAARRRRPARACQPATTAAAAPVDLPPRGDGKRCQHAVDVPRYRVQPPHAPSSLPAPGRSDRPLRASLVPEGQARVSTSGLPNLGLRHCCAHAPSRQPRKQRRARAADSCTGGQRCCRFANPGVRRERTVRHGERWRKGGSVLTARGLRRQTKQRRERRKVVFDDVASRSFLRMTTRLAGISQPRSWRTLPAPRRQGVRNLQHHLADGLTRLQMFHRICCSL